MQSRACMQADPGSKLDAREQHFRIASHLEGLHNFMRYLPPTANRTRVPNVVLYVHGATFPSALSIAHRFDDRSWRDDLADAGFHVWALDFLGYGGSDRYPEMALPAERHAALGRAESAARQIEAAARFICARQDVPKISIIAHSWGAIATGLFAARHPDLVRRMVFFGPIVQRPVNAEPPDHPAWRHVSVQDQRDRFTADVPPGAAPVLSKRHFNDWGERYLDTDPESRTRSPASVRTPSGPWQDIGATWAGDSLYDPRRIQAPVAIVRGEWDSFVTDDDARHLFTSLQASPVRRDVKISRGTHVMHLEESRYQLYRETECFLQEHDTSRAS